MMRMAMFSPVPPVRSGISDYTERLLPHLSKHWEIDLFLDGYGPEIGSVARTFTCHHRREFDLKHQRHSYDQIVYQIGNNDCHDYIYPTLFRYPGMVILHDANLHRARARASFIRDRLDDYLREIEYCHGSAGRVAGRLVAAGMYNDQIYDQFPMLNLAVEGASGVIVHNQYCRDRVSECRLQGEVFMVPAPYMEEVLPDRISARKTLGIDPGSIVIAAFGFIAPGKGLEAGVTAFERVRNSYDHVRLILIGEALDADYIDKLIAPLSPATRKNLTITGFVPPEQFRTFLAASDICLNMRYPTQGEASSALLRIMAAKKPVLIPWYRQYMEIPRDCCVHVDLYPNEIHFIEEAIRMLIDHPSICRQIGANAAAYVKRLHTEENWASAIADAINTTIRNASVPEPLMKRLDLPNTCPIGVIDTISASIGDFHDVFPASTYETLEHCLEELELLR